MDQGGKLEGLELLAKHQNLGFKLVKFHSIEPSLFDEFVEQRLQGTGVLPKCVYAAIKSIAKQYLGKPVIVRSNSLNEGGINSFRGIYESIVVNSTNEMSLASAVSDVYESFFSIKAENYRAERGVLKDKLGVLIGEFIEPEFSGVMHTSNPSYPSDLTIEFCEGRNKVVEGSVQPSIVDFDKMTSKEVFRSENLGFTSPSMIGLFNIGRALESKIGPSSIEFLIKERDIYFLQREPINDLTEPVDVVLPKFNKSMFLGSTNVMRGSGQLTLPVVKAGDWEEIADKVSLLSLTGDIREANGLIRSFINRIVESDKKFSQGYALILPHFYERELAESVLLPFSTSFDGMTKNKKAVITTDCASISSHIMTIARERGIAYAGFKHSRDFDCLSTGDTISIYFKGRKAVVFREQTPYQSLKEAGVSLSIVVKGMDGSVLAVDTKSDAVSHKVFTSDFGYFLEKTTGKSWDFKPYGGRMGGVFIDEKNQAIFMSIHSFRSQYGFHLDSGEHSRAYGYNSVPENDFTVLLKSYIQHLEK